MAITNSSFEYGNSGIFRLIPTIVSNNGFEYGISAIQPLMNIFPKVAELISPISGRRVSEMPTFLFKIQRDYNRDSLHCELFISENADLSSATKFSSYSNVTGWEYYNDVTTSWIPFASTGVPDSAMTSGFTNVRFTPSASLTQSKVLYWGVRVYDTKDYSFMSNINILKSANKLSVEFNIPIETSINAEKILVTAMSTIPTDGEVKADYKLFVTNNAFDDVPTWEDATLEMHQKRTYTFTNTTKTATNWGINIRYEIYANDSLNEISLEGLGISFN